MLVKTCKLFFNLYRLINFFVSLVSSQAIKETFFKILVALKDKSFKFPIGVPTIYKTLLSGSGFLWEDEYLIFIK